MTHGLSAPPRRAFQTQVSGVADKILFGGAFVLGAGLIVGLKLTDARQWLISLGIVVCMLGYVLICLSIQIAQIREDIVADNVYYLGFLYTLTSLGMALYQVASVQDDRLIEDLLSNFGIALLSTILGIFLRVMVSQIRRDPVEVEREARLELVEAATRLKGEFRDIIVQFNDFRTEMTQILREGAELTIRQQGEALRQYGETLGTEIRSVAERVSTDLAAPLASGAEDVGRATDALRSRADELAQQLSASAAELRKSAGSFTKALDDSSRRAGALAERFAEETGRVHGQAVDASGTLVTQLALLRTDLGRLRDTMAQQSEALRELGAQIDQGTQAEAGTGGEPAPPRGRWRRP
ncbi:hypothetical protein [Inquilinus limosus]|uniref:Uncharacterized protein n=1 Tax=Inquilinus limosus TaxID=171674 RepID=A0A211ZFH6_9PROT|nr:hypothetical protein [Inquilinus limosus]OWJ64021.1 hypothetical protein BWR60_26835 [Inquilinus limosus]